MSPTRCHETVTPLQPDNSARLVLPVLALLALLFVAQL